MPTSLRDGQPGPSRKRAASKSPEAPSPKRRTTTGPGQDVQDKDKDEDEDEDAATRSISPCEASTVSSTGYQIDTPVASPSERHSEASEQEATEAPGTEALGTEAPGTEAPGTEAPGTEVPGTEDLEDPDPRPPGIPANYTALEWRKLEFTTIYNARNRSKTTYLLTRFQYPPIWIVGEFHGYMAWAYYSEMQDKRILRFLKHELMLPQAYERLKFWRWWLSGSEYVDPTAGPVVLLSSDDGFEGSSGTDRTASSQPTPSEPSLDGDDADSDSGLLLDSGRSSSSSSSGSIYWDLL